MIIGCGIVSLFLTTFRVSVVAVAVTAMTLTLDGSKLLNSPR